MGQVRPRRTLPCGGMEGERFQGREQQKLRQRPHSSQGREPDAGREEEEEAVAQTGRTLPELWTSPLGNGGCGEWALESFGPVPAPGCRAGGAPGAEVEGKGGPRGCPGFCRWSGWKPVLAMKQGRGYRGGRRQGGGLG